MADPPAPAEDDPPQAGPAGGSRDPARRGSRVDAFRHLVGVLPDAEVAAMAGVTTSGVLQYRQRHGIPAAGRKGGASEDNGAARTRTRAPSRIEAFHHLVGVLSDGEVAARAGVTANAVQMYRRKRGIPAAPAGQHGRTATPTPAARAANPGSSASRPADLDPSSASRPADLDRSSASRPADLDRSSASRPADLDRSSASRPADLDRSSASRRWAAPPPRSGRTFGWRITLHTPRGEVVRYAVAADAVSACRLAEGIGEVARVERLGEALS